MSWLSASHNSYIRSLVSHSVHIQYITETGNSSDKSIRLSPLAAARPLTIHSRPEALDATRFRRACLPAPGRNARHLLTPIPPNQLGDHHRWLILTIRIEWNQPPFHEALHVVSSSRLIEPNSTPEPPPRDSE